MRDTNGTTFDVRSAVLRVSLYGILGLGVLLSLVGLEPTAKGWMT
jgi:hypothetical protein